MMISICAANVLCAGALYKVGADGTLIEVEKDPYSSDYRTKKGHYSVDKSEILVLSRFDDIGIAFGDGAYADDRKPGGGGIAIGVRARAKRDPSVSGPGEGNIAIGNDAQATGHMAIALGSNSKAEQQHSIAIGFGADSSEKDHSVAVGQNSKATGLESSAFGSFAKALGEHSVGIGYRATAKGRSSIALGNNAKIIGDEQGSTAIGWGAEASGYYSNAIGREANASGQSNAIGFGAQSLNQSSAIGEAAYSKGRYSSAIGHQARSYANNSVAIGSNAVTYGRDKNTYTSAYSSISIGEFARAGLSEKLTQSEYDELDGRLQKNYYVKDGNGYKLKPFDIESNRGNIAIGTYSLATSIRSVAIGIGAESMSSNAVSLGYGSKALWNDSTALGSKAKAMANYSTAVGYGALARSERSVSVGYEAKAGLEEELDESRYNSLADTYKQYYKKDNGKYKLKNSNQNNIAIGYNSESLGSSSLALGYGSMAAKDHAISLGTKSNTQGSYGISVGHEAKALNDNSIALGYQASAQKDNSVALGGKSVASTGSKVIGLDFATNGPSDKTDHIWRSTAGAVSVGDETKKITRQITNVAAGTKDTDAVNVAQIKSLTNQGFHTQADYNATDITKGNDVSHKLGGIIKVGGNFKPSDGGVLSNANMDTYLSGKNLATSIDDYGNINLLMAKTPKFDDINISKDGKGGDYTNLTEWIKSIENSSQANNIKYFSVNSKETGNADNKGATGKDAIAIGPKAEANSTNSIAMGLGARSRGLRTVAIGAFSNAEGNLSTAIGYNAHSEGYTSVALGNISKAKGIDAVAIGNHASAEKRGSMALGAKSGASNMGSIAVGPLAQSYGYGSIAVGTGSNAFSHNSVAIGSASQAGDRDSVNLTKKYYMLSVQEYNNLPQNEKDLFQKETILRVRPKPNGNGYEYYDEDVYFVKNRHQTAVGQQSWAKGYESTALGANSEAFGHYSLSTGAFSHSDGEYSSAIGYESNASGNFSTAIGSHAVAKEQNSIALGAGSQANINNSVALGSDSVANTKAGIEGKYFGVGENDKKGTATWTSTRGAVSVGDKDNNITRQITNVAAGYADTDAVNVAQLKSLKSFADKGLYFQGDDNKSINKQLGSTLSITGGAEANNSKLAQGNIAVLNKDGNLTIALAKNLTDLESVTVGNTIIKDNNISVGKNISITDKEIKNGNVTIASNSINIADK
ncbi:hypothetical protein, partial [Campylobacter ureolyticus]